MAQVVEGKDFTISKWAHPSIEGEPISNFQCTKCQYSTVFPLKIQEHYDLAAQGKHRHDWKYPPEQQEDTPAPRTQVTY